MIELIEAMHEKFGVHAAVDQMDDSRLYQLLDFRMRMLTEEYDETITAFIHDDAEELIDGLIDICVIALGTLDLFDVDAREAFTKVMQANLSKEVGVKPGRPNPLGLPDLIKPEGWEGPDHSENHGYLEEIL